MKEILERINALKEAYVSESNETERTKIFYEIYNLEYDVQHTWIKRENKTR